MRRYVIIGIIAVLAFAGCALLDAGRTGVHDPNTPEGQTANITDAEAQGRAVTGLLGFPWDIAGTLVVAGLGAGARERVNRKKIAGVSDRTYKIADVLSGVVGAIETAKNDKTLTGQPITDVIGKELEKRGIKDDADVIIGTLKKATDAITAKDAVNKVVTGINA